MIVLVDHDLEENHSFNRILGEDILGLNIDEAFETTIDLIELGIEIKIYSFPVILEEIKEVVVGQCGK